jgi:hypothetical protein
MSDLYRPVAERMLTQMKHLFQPQVTYRRADPSEFPQLDLRAYEKIGAELAALGFRHLVDLENMHVSTAPSRVIAPTFTRAFTSPDGTIVAGLYQVRRLRRRNLRSFAQGLLSLGWVAAPRKFFRRTVTGTLLGFATEFEDGTTIATSNALRGALIELPPQIQCEYHHRRTPTELLLRRHEERMAARRVQGWSVRALVTSSVEDLLASFARSNALKYAHREAVGWLTREEVRSMSPGRPDVADAMYAEIQRLLRESAAPSSQ